MTTTIDGDSAVIGPTSIDDTDSPYTTQGEQYIEVDTSNGAVTITLASADAVNGREIRIIDTGENASTNNITINTEGSENINPGTNSSITLTLDGTYVDLFSFGTNWFSDRATEKQTAAIGSLASSVDAQGNDLNSVGAANIDDTTIGNSWNDAIVAYPGEKTIQQAYNEAAKGDSIIIAGEHVENEISIPLTRDLDLFWFGSVENTGTAGEHTFVHPDSVGPARHNWYWPRIIGNAQCGDAFHCPGGTDNQPNQFGLFDPHISDHGGYALKYHGPVLSGAVGTYGHAQFFNNGQAQTNPTNIYISGSSTTTIFKGIHFSTDTDTGRNIHFAEGNHSNPYIGQITDNGSDICFVLEGWYNGNIQGPVWFENTGTSDIRWTEGTIGDNGMFTNPSIQTGAIKWDSGVEFDSSRANQTIWFEDGGVSLSSSATKPRNELYTLTTPRLTSDPPNGLQNRAYYYIRTDLSPSEVRVTLPQDLIGDTTQIATLGTF